MMAHEKSTPSDPNPRQQPFNDPIPTVDEYRADWTKLYFLAPVVEEKPKKIDWVPQDNHAQPRGHPMENFELTIQQSSPHPSSNPYPEHFQTTVEDFNRSRQYQVIDSCQAVNGKHDFHDNPSNQRTGNRSNVQQIPNPETTLQSPSNNSLEQQRFQSESNKTDFCQYDRQKDAQSHQLPDTLHSNVNLPTIQTIEKHTMRKITTDSKEASHQDFHIANNHSQRKSCLPNFEAEIHAKSFTECPPCKTDTTEL